MSSATNLRMGVVYWTDRKVSNVGPQLKAHVTLVSPTEFPGASYVSHRAIGQMTLDRNTPTTVPGLDRRQIRLDLPGALPHGHTLMAAYVMGDGAWPRWYQIDMTLAPGAAPKCVMSACDRPSVEVLWWSK
ncbi:MAG: hypothetical protein RIT81_33875 [Deltaproteobacteria bacterium]